MAGDPAAASVVACLGRALGFSSPSLCRPPRASNAEFFWKCPTCHRAFARPEAAARCHRPAKEPPTVAAPLVRWSELAMFDGHPLALTGWLEADQAELTVLHRRPKGGFSQPLCHQGPFGLRL